MSLCRGFQAIHRDLGKILTVERHPSIAVIMSVYNGERFLEKSIESILSQTFSDFMFYISDDGSSDNSKEILEKYKNTDDRIHLINGKNIGLTARLNQLISISKSPFIARMDADDISMPGRFAAQKDFLEENPKSGVVGTGFVQIDENDRVCRGLIRDSDDYALKNGLLSGRENPFTHGSVMMRRKVLEDLYPVYRFKYSQDLDLWLRLQMLCEFGMIEKVLYKYRHHSSAIHSNHALTLKRQIQRQALIQAAKNGKIFNNDYCEKVVYEIWTSDIPENHNEINKIKVLSDNSFRALMVRGRFPEARARLKVLMNQSKNYKLQAHLFMLLLNMIPNTTLNLLDFITYLRNKTRSSKILSFMSLKKYSY